MKENPKILKKRLAFKRREHARALDAANDADAEYQDAVANMLPKHFITEKRGEFLGCVNTVSKIEEEMKQIESELFGDWAPDGFDDPDDKRAA